MKPVDPVLIGSLLEQLRQLTIALQNQDSFTSKWLPSIVGFSSTVVAFLVGWFAYRASKEQIKTSRAMATAQIKSAEEIAKSQLENAREITISQIKANLVAASRKEWIENLRKNITELFSLANDVHLKRDSKNILLEADARMWHLITYIELMLNPLEAEHRDFIIKQQDFIKFCVDGEDDVEQWRKLKREYLSAAKIILKSEWNKVKELI